MHFNPMDKDNNTSGPVERGRKLLPSQHDRIRKSQSMSTDRGRRPPPSPRSYSPAPTGPIKAHHYMGTAYIRDESPHIAMDRITRNISSSQVGSTDDIDPRIPQPYRTSFSAVTSPRRVAKSQSVRSPLVNTKPNFIAGNPLGMSRGFPVKANSSLYKGASFSNNNNSRNGSRTDIYGSDSSQRQITGSRDLSVWSHGNRSCDEMSDSGHMSSDRIASCDTIDGRDDVVGDGTSFDNRRLNPKYSSTPTRLPNSPNVTAVTNGNASNHDKKYSRLESNVSADTLDSVFMPNTPHSPLTDQDTSMDFYGNQPNKCIKNKVTAANVTMDDPSLEISKPPDSGFVEGRVEKKKCIEREYVHIIDVTHEDLMKAKKKKRLPEPNEETVSLVREMMNNLERRLQARSASAPGTPLHSNKIDRHPLKNKDKGSLGKKSLSSSITNFFRKISMSPRTLKKGQKKKGKRSKSAGRLEGNRSLAGSNSSMGYRDISLEPTSTGSSDQSSTVLQTNSLNRPIKDTVSSQSSSKKQQSKSTGYSIDDKENSLQRNGANHITMTTSNNIHDGSHMSRSNKSNVPSTRVYLKSIEDNNTMNRTDDRTVYRTFKEKQSPSYRRHAEVGNMKSQALKVVDVGNDKHHGLVQSSVHSQSFDTIGDCSLDVYNRTGSDPSITTQSSIPPTEIASRVTLNSKNEVVTNGVHLPPEQLHNGSIADVHHGGVQRNPSYLKISCSISGYKNYGSYNKHPPLDGKQHIEVTTNNNVISHNGSVSDDSPPVYSPTGSSYVKGLSQKFETLNTSDNVSPGGNNKLANKGVKPKGNSVSPSHTGNNKSHTGAINTNNVNQSQALLSSTNDKSMNSSHEVDSQNIDFKQARLAFDSSQSNRSADTSTEVTENARRSSSGRHSQGELGLDLTSLTHQNGVANDAGVFGDETDNISTAYKVHTDINSIENLEYKTNKGSNDTGLSLENGFVNEASTTPSQVRVEALRDEESKHIAVSKSVGSSSQDISSLSSDHQGALSCQSSTDGLNSSTASINKGGRYFLSIVDQEEEAIQQLCSQAEQYLNNTLTDDVSGKIRAAIGKGFLLTSKKFKQFKGLCDQNINQSDDSSFQTTAQDLAGFWDMVMIQVDDVKESFKELDKLRGKGWKVSPKHSPQPRKTLNGTPKSAGKKSSKSAPMSAKAQEAARARAEARRKLIEAKKAGRQQRKTSESEDVEIFVS